jgi:two-component system response regulator YesN
MTEEDRELLRYACQNIMVEYLGSLNTSTCISYAVDRFAWVIQPTDIRDTEIPLDEKEILWRNLQSRMGSIAEAAQAACAHWLQIPISLALGKAPCAWEHFREEVQHLDKLLKENEYRGGELLIQDYDREVRQHDSFSDTEDESVLPDRSNRLIAHIHNYVMLNLNQELSLTRVSEYVHHSPTYLSRLYRRLTGTTLFEYITEQRMSRAKQYLQGDGMKIHEIASAVGYESAPHFTRFFKKREGMTPQEYRDRRE